MQSPPEQKRTYPLVEVSDSAWRKGAGPYNIMNGTSALTSVLSS